MYFNMNYSYNIILYLTKSQVGLRFQKRHCIKGNMRSFSESVAENCIKINVAYDQANELIVNVEIMKVVCVT